jgi:hypothetical protein
MAAGGIITTGSHPKALWPGVHAFWGQVFNEHPPEYPDLFDIDESDQAYEEDVQITGFGLAQVKPEGSPIAYDSEVQGPVTRYVHIAYALGYVVTYEELRDNLYEAVSMRRAKANAFSMVQTLENIAAGFYNRAFNTSYALADGQPLISTAHPFTTGGSFSNALSPAADLSEASLEDVCIQLMGFTTDRGLLVNFMPMSLHVPRQEWYNANRILKSVLQNDTTNNALNVLKATNAFPKGIRMNHYFSAPHAWFVRTNAMNGLQFFWRDQPMFDQDNDFDTKNAKAATYMRFSLGCTDPRAIIGSNGP